MTSITVDELESRLRDVIAGLAHGGESIAVTLEGMVVATLSPSEQSAGAERGGATPAMSEEEVDAFWAPWRPVWDAVGDSWPAGVSAVDAVREQRRG